MKLATVVDICGGQLLNAPGINYVTNIRTNPARVKREDLFIATNNDEIKDAVARGAFCVIFSGECEILDQDVAFVKVGSVAFAILAFFRYLFASKNFPAFLVSKYEYEIAKSIAKSKDLAFVDTGNLTLILEDLELMPAKMFVFYEDLLGQNIFFNAQKIPPASFAPTKVSLFQTAFLLQETYHSAEIFRLFSQDLLNVVSFFAAQGVEFNVKNIRLTSFEVIRLDRLNNISKDGQKTLIFCEMDLSEKIAGALRHARVCKGATPSDVERGVCDFFIIDISSRAKWTQALQKTHYKQGDLFE